jgi:dUTP pyrophosphatase
MEEKQFNGLVIKIAKLRNEAQTPIKSTEHAAGFDLFATDYFQVKKKYIEYYTGIAIEIPVGYTGFLFPRSSISEKGLMLKNSVGVIDADYRGEIKLRFKNFKKFLREDDRYAIGDKIGQLIILETPLVNLNLVPYSDLSNTERSTKGFGSTGR